MFARYIRSIGFRAVIVTLVTFLVLFPTSALINLARQNTVLVNHVSSLEQLMRENLKTNAINLIESTARTFQNAILGMDFSFLKVSLETIMKKDPALAYGVIFHHSGVVMVEQLQRPATTVTSAAISERLGKANIPSVSIDDLQLDGEPIMEIATPVIVAGKSWGTIVFGFSQASLNTKLSGLRAQLQAEKRRATIRTWITTLVFLLIGLISSMIAGRIVSRPIQELTSGARLIGQGNLDWEIDVRSKNEIGLLATSFNQMARSLKTLLMEAEEKKRMELELATARTIQRFIIPREEPRLGRLEFAGTLKTSSEIGGDFFDYFPLDDRGRVGMVVGDVSGHGVAAGLIVAAIKSVLLIEKKSMAELSDMMEMLNRVVYALARQELLTTCFLGLFDPQTQLLTYANAGHNYPYLYRNREHRLEELEYSTFPLGLSPTIAVTPHTVRLDTDDILVLYTDGIIETTNRGGEAYDYERFEDSIRLNHNRRATDIRSALLQSALDFYGDKSIDDDIALLVVRQLNCAEQDDDDLCPESDCINHHTASPHH